MSIVPEGAAPSPYETARRCFLDGNGLPGRWRGRSRFTVLDTGFGAGTSFLAAWSAWREDADHCGVLHVVAIEPAPLERAARAALVHDPLLAPLATELEAHWPPHTANLHRLSFENGAVQLLLAFGEVGPWLRRIVAEVDAFCIGGSGPADDPASWHPAVFKSMARLAARDATFATSASSAGVRDALTAAGFVVAPAAASGIGPMTMHGGFAPRFTPPRGPNRDARHLAAASPRRAEHEPVLIVGGGLAGCAVAAALAEAGRPSIVLERNLGVAQEASGNAGGLFHGVVHAGDGRHARFFRAAALAARTEVGRAVAAGVPGSVGGLLRLEFGADLDAMRATIRELRLPIDYVRAIDAAEASRLAGTRLGASAWHFTQGGWVDPAALCAFWLARAGSHVEVRCGTDVAAVRRVGGGDGDEGGTGDGDPAGDGWQLIGHAGQVLARARTVVLAHAGDGIALPGEPPWPVSCTRGQLSALATSRVNTPSDPEGDGWPRLPVTGAGYVLPPLGGRLWFGASTQRGDDDRAVRESDHGANLDRLRAMLPCATHWPVPSEGRTAFRWVADDRLPMIGAVPDMARVAGRPGLDRPQRVPRLSGLFSLAALGSRGIASACLGGRIVAAWITGAPVPLESDLLDAIDPARFVSRAVRRAASSQRAAVGPGLGSDDQPPLGPMAGGSAGG